MPGMVTTATIAAVADSWTTVTIGAMAAPVDADAALRRHCCGREDQIACWSVERVVS